MEQCYGKNEEILERVFPGKFTEEEKKELGNKKEEAYREEYKTFLTLISGLHELLEAAKN